MRVRSIATLCLFALAAGVALKYQVAGLGICIYCLIVYLRPNPPLATFRRKIREAECWGRIGAFAIFCKPGRI